MIIVQTLAEANEIQNKIRTRKVANGAQWAGEPLTESEQSALKLALDNYFSAL